MRHPSYFGFFAWAVGTQILLGNPICLIVFLKVLWNFFRERISYEELILLKFFSNEYLSYKNEVPSGIPFIK